MISKTVCVPSPDRSRPNHCPDIPQTGILQASASDKTDHLCQPMISNVHEVQTVYNVVQDPQIVLLSEKGAHGVSARRKKLCMLLPQRRQGSTTVASQTNPVSPVHMASANQPASSDWQRSTEKCREASHVTVCDVIDKMGSARLRFICGHHAA